MARPTLSLDQLRAVARLARLALTDDEEREMLPQLQAILDHAASLEALDLAGVEPQTHAVPITAPRRDDVPAAGLDRAEALEAAPRAEDGCFTVPRFHHA